MTPLRHPAPDRTTGAKLADTDIYAGRALAQPHFANTDSTMTEVVALAGGFA